MRIRGVINRVGGEERRGSGPSLLYLLVLMTWPPWRNNGGWELEAPQIRGLSASAQKQKRALLPKLLQPQEWLLTGFKDQGHSPSPYPYLPQNPDRNTKKGKEGKDSTFTLSQRPKPIRSQLPYSVFVPHHRSFSPIPFWGQRIWLTLQGKLRSGVLLPVQWLVAILQLSTLPSTWRD